ncbi:hypothetical protein [Clostridium perfringens]|uniref:hypothetical protein n=1 Tax=Clostridium perfringens TaxID=1502 RepID=UPI0039EC68EF
MNERIIKKINERIIKTNINLTYKEFIDLLAEIQKKDNEIEYLRNTIEDMMEEESEEFEEDDLLDELEDEYWDELQEESDRLRKELKEVKKVSESRYDLLLKAVEEIEEKDKLIKELRKENMELKMEKAAKKIQESDIKFSEELEKYIAKSGLISLKSCLNAIDLLSDKGEK